MISVGYASPMGNAFIFAVTFELDKMSDRGVPEFSRWQFAIAYCSKLRATRRVFSKYKCSA